MNLYRVVWSCVYLTLISQSVLAALKSPLTPVVNSPACSCEIVIAQVRPRIEFGFELFNAQPNDAGSNYALQSRTSTTFISNPIALPITTGQHRFSMHSVSATREIGYGFHLGVRGEQTGQDFQVRYEHWMGSDDDLVRESQPGRYDIMPLGLSIPPTLRAQIADARVGYDTALFDIEAGQWLTFRRNLQWRLYSGVRFASIQQKITRRFTTVNTQELQPFPNGAMRATERQISRYQGWGPRVGNRWHQTLPHHLGLGVDLSAAILLGRINDDYRYEDSLSPQNRLQLASARRIALVPVIDATISADYHYQFANHLTGRVEVGYRALNFFNSVQYAATQTLTTLNLDGRTDFARRGIFLRVTGWV